jgi:hypothetical protein
MMRLLIFPVCENLFLDLSATRLSATFKVHDFQNTVLPIRVIICKVVFLAKITDLHAFKDRLLNLEAAC